MEVRSGLSRSPPEHLPHPTEKNDGAGFPSEVGSWIPASQTIASERTGAERKAGRREARCGDYEIGLGQESLRIGRIDTAVVLEASERCSLRRRWCCERRAGGGRPADEISRAPGADVPGRRRE